MKKYLIIFIAVALILSWSSMAIAAPQGVAKHITFKGLNTRAGPLSLDDGESPDCLNVHTSIFGTLIKRNGYEKNNTAHSHITTSPGKFNGLFDYAIDSSTRYLIGYVDTLLYKMDDLDGKFDPIYSNGDTTADNIMEFVNFDGTLLFTTWSRDYLRYWTGTGNSAHVQIIPTGKHIVLAYNRVFMSDCTVSGTTYELRFYYSNAGSYTAWTTDYDYETLDASTGDRAMGWGLLKGRLFGFTKYTISLISDVGGVDPIQVKRRIDGTGCGAPRTIKTINHPKFGECLIFLTSDKRLVLYNGSGVVDVSEKVFSDNIQSSFAMERITTASLEKSHAVVYEPKGWYVLFVPISSDIDYSLVYDFKTDTLWPNNNQNFESSTIVETTTGNFMYAGDRTGRLFKLDATDDDNGAAINGYWVSRRWDFGFAPYLKKMGETQVALKGIGNYDLNYQNRYNWDESWSVAEALNMKASAWVLGDALPAELGGKKANSHRLTIPMAFNLYQIKFSSNTTNPAFEIYSLDVVTSNLGDVGE